MGLVLPFVDFTQVPSNMWQCKSCHAFGKTELNEEADRFRHVFGGSATLRLFMGYAIRCTVGGFMEADTFRKSVC